MKQSRARRVWLLGLGAVAAPALVASIAYACTSLATLNMNPGSGSELTTVNGTGRGFSASDASSPVEIHFGSRTGTVLWAGRANAQGEITYAFQIPAGTAPGQYAIIATQFAASGNAIGGTPARAAFEVTGAPAAVAAAPALPTEQLGAAPAPAPAPASAPAPVSTPAARPAPAVRTPAPAPAPAPVAPAPAPAAVAPAPAPEPAAVAPAPVAPAPVAPAPAPAPAGTERSVMVNTADDGGNGSPWLAISLVGLGLVLTLGATALVLSSRRDRKAPAAARR